MNDTLLEMSESNYKAALLMYDNSINEESHINFAAYHCQQAFELYLKHYLEINGVRYDHTHKIDILLDQICNNNITLPLSAEVFKELDIRSVGISEFEADTRYIKNFIVSKRRVKELLDLLNKMLKESKSNELNNRLNNENRNSTSIKNINKMNLE